jgi:hypothetical protein
MKALRPIRHEEIQAGEFVYLLTDVQFGHDGIKNLRHYIPLEQTQWHFYQAVSGHVMDTVFDAVPHRLTTRVTAVNGGAKQSKIRKTFILPDDFGRFPADALIFKVRRSAATPVSFLATLYHGSVTDPAINGISIFPTIATPDYELKLLTPSHTYYPGDFATLELESNTNATGQWLEISDIELAYKTARGNI